MRVYYFLSNLDRQDYDFFCDKVKYIKDISDIEYFVNAFYIKVGQSAKGKINRGAILEAVSFIKYYIAELGGKMSDIIWVYNKNFLIHNNDVYIYESKKWVKIEEEVFFVTTRDTWYHPFFYLLFAIQSKGLNKKIYIIKQNNRSTRLYADKIYHIAQMYELRQEMFGDVVVPYFMNIDFEVTQNLLKKLFDFYGDKFVIKRNVGEMGQQVKVIKKDNVNADTIELVKRMFFSDSHKYFWGSYVVPYYDIEKEIRVYYLLSKDNNKKSEFKLYSAKQKTTLGNDGKSLDQVSCLGMYEYVTVEWNYYDPDELKKAEKKVVKTIEKIARSLDNDCGVMEVCKLKNGDVRFLEINQVGGSLMFPGKDQLNMVEYYVNMRDDLYNKYVGNKKTKKTSKKSNK